jgi:flagellar hook-associated protein 1 FlgK
MSFFGLGLAGKSLAAFESALNVTSDNLNNASTPGASRQIVNLTEAPPIAGSPFYASHFGPGTLGDGVIVQSITRVHQDSYDGLFRGASSSSNYYTIQQQQLQATQATLSEPHGGINDTYSQFQNAIQGLIAHPSDPNARQNVVGTANALTSALSGASNAIQQQQLQVQNQTNSTIVQLNDTLDRIAALNGQIRASTAVGDNPNTYKDQRDHLIDQLSQYLSTTTSIQSTGSVLVTVNGRALVNDTIAYHLAPSVVAPNTSGVPNLVIGFANDPNPINPTTVPLGSGQLAGYTDLYNNKLLAYGKSLDAFALGLAIEYDRVTQSAYDASGVAGVAIFQPIVTQRAISASNIKVGPTDQGQVTAALATTAANSPTSTLFVPFNSANNPVDTNGAINGNATFAVAPPAGAVGIQGSLTIGVNGVQQTFKYDTGTVTAAGNQATRSVAEFLTSFNSAQLGVSATFDPGLQKIVFSRDPTNESLAQRGLPGYAPGPSFALTDSNNPQAGAAASLLGVFGASGSNLQATAAIAAGAQTVTVTGGVTDLSIGTSLVIDAGTASAETVIVSAINTAAGTFTATFANAHAGPNPTVTVRQDNTNAFGALNNQAANALQALYSTKVGVPGYQATSPTAVIASPLAQTISPVGGVSFLVPGELLTVDAGTANQEDVVIDAVNPTTGQLTATFGKAHAANFTITSSRQQTIAGFYGNLITNVGLDAARASTGASTQTLLSANIDKVRQGIDGINSDEETQNLVTYQRAYQAAARVVTTMDSLLGTVIQTMGLPATGG